MFNFYESKLQQTERFRLLRCGDSMLTFYNCPLENKFADIWSQHNYIIYITEGKKVWHTAHGSFRLQEGDCVFVRKGATIVEQFFDASFCLVIFFISDEFICDTLKRKSTPITSQLQETEPVTSIHRNEKIEAFFSSMLSYFEGIFDPDPSLVELKFRELVLTVADDPENAGLRSYFCSLLQDPQSVSLQRVMDDNYCFNLKLEAYAQLTNRSLSAFKRDFKKHFNTTPGKWLLEKRLNHSMHLLTNLDKTVSEAAFESGFENSSHFSRSFKERFGVSPIGAKGLH
jgi:AraC-like DNA-binding protein